MSTRVALSGYVRYRGGLGQLMFVLHRVTGLGILLFLIIHILDTATVYFYPSLYNEAIAIYRTTPFMIGEIFLVFSVLFHGVNGVRIALFDLYFPHKWNIESERTSSIWTLVITLILWLPAAIWMLRSLLIYNFGLLGG